MDADQDARVSVVMPARGAAGTIADALESIARQTMPVREIVIAIPPDDAATIEAVRLYENRLPIRVVDNPSGTTPAGLNRAIAVSSGDVIARVDAHAVLPPDYLRRAVAYLEQTGAGNVGGRQFPTDDAGFGRAVATAMLHPLGAGGASYRTGVKAGPADTVYLGVFRRSALQAVGGYDERLARNQDAELNYRLRAAGYGVHLEPELAVAYQPRTSVRSLARQYFDYGRWRRATVQLHPASLRMRQLAAPLLVVLLLVAVVVGLAATSSFLALVAGGYVMALFVAVAITIRSVTGVPLVVIALVVMHLSWGMGFLIGPPSGWREFGSDSESGSQR